MKLEPNGPAVPPVLHAALAPFYGWRRDCAEVAKLKEQEQARVPYAPRSPAGDWAFLEANAEDWRAEMLAALAAAGTYVLVLARDIEAEDGGPVLAKGAYVVTQTDALPSTKKANVIKLWLRLRPTTGDETKVMLRLKPGDIAGFFAV